jgi:glucosamine--fructose-6-phosphate aminotransferase (isomerizing)
MEEIARKPIPARLYLGRGINYPTLEGALKLKEISTSTPKAIRGERNRSWLIDEQMPVIAIATHDHVRKRATSRSKEARRPIITITTSDTTLKELLTEGDSLVAVPATNRLLMPVMISLPLQLLSYYIAVRRGCDVDQPRNLAKSVTVE